MRVLLAPDRLSGPLSAVQAAAALARGWQRRAAGDELTRLALSDGSAGLVDVVHAACGGRLVPLTARGPLGEPVPAAVLHVPGDAGGTAYVEADQVLGTHLTPPGEELRRAEAGTSAGLGDLVLAALRTGASRVVVGLGAGAAHDAGTGALAVLAAAGTGTAPAETSLAGARALGTLAPGDLPDLAAVGQLLRGRDLVLATADDVPLLGLHGAGALLAERPGISPADAQELDGCVGLLADLLERSAAALPARQVLSLASGAGAPPARHLGAGRAARAAGSGAGGGAGLALTLVGGRRLPGAEVVAGAVGLSRAVAGADLVVTAAAELDPGTLVGSVVATVAEAALAEGLPVVVVAEEVHVSRREAARAGISATYRLDPVEPSTGLATLEAWAERLARTWSVRP
ncbi:glycerate kinase [Georgenia faecalis]|uniref:Glycerate kinase n=1 Tax=Georgenia faecalis TaxID=2483799 RepID=A0ABV9DAP2_9MICO